VATGRLVVAVGVWLEVGDDLEGAVGVEVTGAWGSAVPVVLAPELAPGCSLATTAPISAVAPTAARAAERVRRRSRTSARSRDSGEFSWSGCFIAGVRPVPAQRTGSNRLVTREGATRSNHTEWA
jgi:hypothetical protein